MSPVFFEKTFKRNTKNLIGSENSVNRLVFTFGKNFFGNGESLLHFFFLFFFFLFAFFAERNLCPHYHKNGNANENEDHKAATYRDNPGDHCSNRKGDHCGEEPTCNYGENAGDSVNSALASPGPVGQRGTHCHHERYIRC